jgi:hypothetical protein
MPDADALSTRKGVFFQWDWWRFERVCGNAGRLAFTHDGALKGKS